MNEVHELVTVEDSSGNVFADLQCKDPEDRLAKADIAISIGRAIRELGLTQAEAAKTLGIDQPGVSKLLKGQLRGFSTDRLFKFLTALDRDVVITIKPAANRSAHRHACGKISVVAP
ncbi:MAG: helix-turn-helix transcriptional regulator [Armatimonadota bacterium]|nr:helix-turn-helix transcriptional regulator [Armatimonadota bacterium]